MKRKIDDYIDSKMYNAYEIFGAHIKKEDSKYGVRFSVYAPNAKSVRVVGDFNDWNDTSHFMQNYHRGYYTIFIEGLGEGTLYKYVIESDKGRLIYKNDPYGYRRENKVDGASEVRYLENFSWNDEEFIKKRDILNAYDSPISIYELNLSSWKKDGSDYCTFKKLQDELVKYIKYMGYTHIELMPITEHPYDGSWGYQQIGYYAITSRFGTPTDFMEFINVLHDNGIGVIIDWVACHYPKDLGGLVYFDSNALYESSDYSVAYNKEWDTINFDFSKRHVINFMISNINFLKKYYHIDGIRVDAVSNIIYKNSNEHNPYGINFIKEMNTQIDKLDGFITIAEESSAFYGVSKDVKDGGLGFNYKWNMGWMNDTLSYIKNDPIFRQYHHNKLTFPMVYAFSENHILPFSHDEVVHGKRSLVEKMPGSYEDKFSQLKTLMLYQYTQPGKKLNFMGNEFAQFIEWNEWQALDWHLLNYSSHSSILEFNRDLNSLYRNESSLYKDDLSWESFKWISVDNNTENIITYKRIYKEEELIIAINFSAVDKFGYMTPCKDEKKYDVIFNTDDKMYYGKGRGSKKLQSHNGVILLDIPAFSGLIVKEEE